MNLYLTVLTLLLCLAVASAGTVSDGDYSQGAEWGASAAQRFDFVIVGGGAAGPVVAARLSQKYKVLLIEAGVTTHRNLGGTDYVASSFSKDPATGAVTINTPFTRFDVPGFWFTVLDPSLAALYEWNITGAGVAKLLGGCQGHNGMYWQHPTQYNLQTWNITGWNYAQFIPFVRKAENFTNSGFTLDSSLGTSGPIQIRSAAVVLPGEQAFYQACLAAGVPPQPNFSNGINIEGAGFVAFNIGNNGTSVRQTAALTYLAPILGNKNLTIVTKAQATRVLFKSSNSYGTAKPNATGIQFVITTANGSKVKQTVYVNKEVILSAGTLNTAKLLMLSGIGSRAVLSQYGITPIVINNNVGTGIRNHYSYNMVFTGGNNLTNPNFLNLNDQSIAYALSGTGLYATVAGLGSPFVQLKTLPNLVDPDVSVYISLGGLLPFPITAKGVLVTILTTTPEYNNGNLTLTSSNPLADPIYYPNFDMSLNDVNTLVRGIRKVRQIMNTSIAVDYFGSELSPGTSFQTTQQLQGNVRNTTGFAYHYNGSARMGNSGDPTRVVDPSLRVVGVGNLRVIDASVFPNIVNSLVQATVIGVAEKGAAQILADWN